MLLDDGGDLTALMHKDYKKSFKIGEGTVRRNHNRN